MMTLDPTIPQMLSMSDRLFDTLDSLFEVPSSWVTGDIGAPLVTIGQEQCQQMEMINSKEKFGININVKEFRPEQLQVKIVKDRFLVINGRREVEQDTNEGKKYITKEFTRTFVIPKDVDIQQLKSNLNKEGVLTIEAPKMQSPPIQDERTIPIEQGK